MCGDVVGTRAYSAGSGQRAHRFVRRLLIPQLSRALSWWLVSLTSVAWQPATTGTMTAGGLPIDGESLLRFKKHHAPVTFEAARTAAVVLDTLSFRQLALAVLGIVGSCALAAATASVLGLRATRRETIDTYDCKALTSGPWQDRATREQPCRGADGRTESLASSPF